MIVNLGAEPACATNLGSKHSPPEICFAGREMLALPYHIIRETLLFVFIIVLHLSLIHVLIMFAPQHKT